MKIKVLIFLNSEAEII